MLENLRQSFDRVFIHHESKDHQLTHELLKHFDADKIEWVSERPFSTSSGDLSAREFERSKRNIFVTPHRGHFFKRCPGAKKTLACCNYFVLNLGLQCNMNCSYCYLQSYLNTPILTLYSNLEDALNELRDMATQHRNLPYRVGTGETVDSLSMDPLTLTSRRLIEFFREFPNWRLEFKTKSDFVDQFLDVEHAKNVIVSWSINPQEIVEREEHGTASLNSRLDAAQRCLQRGFPIAFHIDPLIWFEGWRDHYASLVDEITGRFSPDDLPYLSLGALRFQPEQKAMMRERFGLKSLVNRSEMFTAKDGKMRYDASQRQEMFDFVLSRFKQNDAKWKLFLCMETPETWIATTDQAPARDANLRELFRALPEPNFV